MLVYCSTLCSAPSSVTKQLVMEEGPLPKVKKKTWRPRGDKRLLETAVETEVLERTIPGNPCDANSLGEGEDSMDSSEPRAEYSID